MSSLQSENLAAVAEAISSPGALLRRAREARGESVHEVAFALKLSPRQVDALERDDFDALPGMAFVRGFMRNYARYVGLDATPLLDAVQRLAGQGSPDLSPIRNADGDLPAGGSRRRGSFPAGAVVLVLLAMLATGWYFDWFRTEPVSVERMLETPAADTAVLDSQPMVVPSAPVEASSVTSMTPTDSPADVRPQTDSAAPTEEAAPAEPVAPVLPAVTGATAEAGDAPVQSGSGGRLAFRFAGESWVEVRDATGAIVYSGVNRAGTERNVQGTPPFALVIGNATNVVLEFDGKPVDLAPHTKVSVARLTVK